MPAKYARKTQPQAPKKKRRRGNAITTIPDYDDDELEFLKAVEKYKRDKHKLFPTYTEILGVLKGLGWKKEKEVARDDN